MTYEEALQETAKRIDPNELGAPEYYELVTAALKIGRPVVPCKANRAVWIDGYLTMLDENEFFKCPSCRFQDTKLRPGQKYCHECGQRLDWSDENGKKGREGQRIVYCSRNAEEES